ncbi:MAG: prohibitin family protein [Bacteroidales bacterium]|nr:prohibitin family protein [Bacteroidales bacterium]MDD5979211.1 prohibitin family protein [Bacteroidales bacterium]
MEFTQQNGQYNKPSNKKFTPIIIAIVALLLVIVFWNRITVTIPAGNGGVLYRLFGGGIDTTKTYEEGFHFIAPWNSMQIYETRQMVADEEMSALSSNGLEIKIEFSTWYQPKWDELGKLHATIGTQYLTRAVIPAMRSAARSVVGRYTPEQIYSTKRDAIQEEIFEETKKLLESKHIQLNQVLIRSVTLPPTIKSAIESKLKQEQEALEYEFKLEKAAQEAERQRVEAEGKAKANNILSASINDKILREKGIEATLKLAESPNAKIVVIGNSNDGMPLILGDIK